MAEYPPVATTEDDVLGELKFRAKHGRTSRIVSGETCYALMEKGLVQMIQKGDMPVFRLQEAD